MFFKELNDVFILLKILFCALFLGRFTCFAFSIVVASDTFGIHKFRYARPSIMNALKKKNNSKAEFLEASVRDFVTSIQNNTNLNSKKGQLLIVAHRAFIIGFFLIGALTALLTFLSLFYKPKEESFVFEKSTDIQLLESAINESKTAVLELSKRQTKLEDSLQIRVINSKLDSLGYVIKNIKGRREK
jgi:hypothetical protein